MSKGYVIEYKDEDGSGTGYSFKKFNTRYEALDFINEFKYDLGFAKSWSEYTIYDLSNKYELEECKESKRQDDIVSNSILNSLY